MPNILTIAAAAPHSDSKVPDSWSTSAKWINLSCSTPLCFFPLHLHMLLGEHFSLMSAGSQDQEQVHVTGTRLTCQLQGAMTPTGASEAAGDCPVHSLQVSWSLGLRTFQALLGRQEKGR